MATITYADFNFQIFRTEYKCAFCDAKKRTQGTQELPNGWIKHITELWERDFKYHYI